MDVNTQRTPGLVVPASEKNEIFDAIIRLSQWLDTNDYSGYDTFDGLNSQFLRRLTFEKKILRQVLQQGVRRFPLNVRPILGIRKSRSTKGMGFIARGYIRLHQSTHDPSWGEKARWILDWLMENESRGYSGACWGNHFDYQSRNSFVKAGVPSVVWTALIGHAFLDAYKHFGDSMFLKVACGACEHIVRDLATYEDNGAICISYFPTESLQVHNANTLGASLLARCHRFADNPEYRYRAEKGMQYTAQYQRQNGSWYYGEKQNLQWVDNFHTAYVLDSFKYYYEGTGDDQFNAVIDKGYRYWKNMFFLSDGRPRYYSFKTLPLDIQCCSQAIDTLVFFHDRDPDSLALALKVARWTIHNMQDASGYFYYRRDDDERACRPLPISLD